MKTITTTSKAKYHKADTTIEVVDSLADKMIAMGWAVPEGSTPEDTETPEGSTPEDPETPTAETPEDPETPTAETPVIQPAVDAVAKSSASKQIKKSSNTKK